MKIKNIIGTSQANCKCGSWLQHWKNFSYQVCNVCGASGCLNTDVVGAHVIKADSQDRKWYIYPLCNSHNQQTGEIEVLELFSLITANKQETCEKPQPPNQLRW